MEYQKVGTGASLLRLWNGSGDHFVPLWSKPGPIPEGAGRTGCITVSVGTLVYALVR